MIKMKPTLTVQIFSFGFQFSGIPRDSTRNNGGFVFDCRHLPNPGREEKYKQLTGLDQPVIDYFQKYPVIEAFLQDVFRMVDRAIENYQERSFSDLMISFGCTGGRHRSIYCTERMDAYLNERGITTIKRHVELPGIRMRAKLAQATIQAKSTPDNAGVTSGNITFCDTKCEYAKFPKDEAIDGAKSCRTFSALWCEKLDQYVVKNAPCSWRFGKRRPKAGW